jgi:hypothetical protein
MAQAHKTLLRSFGKAPRLQPVQQQRKLRHPHPHHAGEVTDGVAGVESKSWWSKFFQ